MHMSSAYALCVIVQVADYEMKLMHMHFSTPLGRTVSNKLAANIDHHKDNHRNTEVSDTHSAGVLKKQLLGFTWTHLVFCKQQGCLERKSCAAATRLGLYHVLSNVIASLCLLGALCAPATAMQAILVSRQQQPSISHMW